MVRVRSTLFIYVMISCSPNFVSQLWVYPGSKQTSFDTCPVRGTQLRWVVTYCYPSLFSQVILTEYPRDNTNALHNNYYFDKLCLFIDANAKRLEIWNRKWGMQRCRQRQWTRPNSSKDRSLPEEDNNFEMFPRIYMWNILRTVLRAF